MLCESKMRTVERRKLAFRSVTSTSKKRQLAHASVTHLLTTLMLLVTSAALADL